MKGAEEVLLDANVVIRLLTGEPPEMATRAEALFERAARGEFRLLLTPLVVAECVWVLRSFYKQPLADVAAALQQVGATEGVRLQPPGLIGEALEAMAHHNVDFADAYLAAQGRGQGQQVCSFDGDFRKLGARVLTP